MSRPPRRPLERVLLDRGLASTLEAARALVASGSVLVAGAPALEPTRAVARDEPVVVVAAPRFVGRGGEKLEGALRSLDVDVAGRRALDVGSSTGGFTDCLLSLGVVRVLAVDVGRHQLHERLRADSRVVSLERTNVRDLTAEDVAERLGAAPSVVVVDLAFTSVVTHAATVVGLVAKGADLVVLVKPQFEVDYVTVSRGRGVVADAAAWREALARAASAFASAGAGIIGVVTSPLTGHAGNVEFFLHGVAGAPSAADLAARIDAAIAAAPAGGEG